MRVCVIALIGTLICPLMSGAQYATWNSKELTLDNGLVKRIMKLPAAEGNFLTTFYKPANGEFHHLSNENTDFRFLVDNRVYSGRDKWNMISVQKYADRRQGNGAAIKMISPDRKIELVVKFLLYPGSPTVRKNLEIKNLTGKPVVLEDVDIEHFNTFNMTAMVDCWVYHDYGRRKTVGPYEGNMQDALVIVHDPTREQGLVIGNEAPGVIKHTTVFFEDPVITSGLTPKNARFPFRKYIQPGQVFETPQVFTMLYNRQKTTYEVLNKTIPDFVRNYMGARLFELDYKPELVYDTWIPFFRKIDHTLVDELATAAAKSGVKEFVIDDGWQENYGDWEVDKQKFPNGLKPVFDSIRTLGMKPGIWVSVGSVSKSSKVYKTHPEWFVTDSNQSITNLHTALRPDMATGCMGTGWYNHIKSVLIKLIKDYGVEYLKLDFAVVTSPYRFNNHLTSGCYATNHPGHQDRYESFYSNYQDTWKLFDELRVIKPDLFIDCTFETMGGMQLIDYAMLQHAEGNWLSNFMGPKEIVDLRIRNMAWWRSPAIPATALVIGNAEMQDSLASLHLKSLAGALPVILGDPRKLTGNKFEMFRSYTKWIQQMEKHYEIMSYRQDLPTFSEPMEGQWDGFQRINTESGKGGILGVFRHGALETARTVTVSYLEPGSKYQLLDQNRKPVVIMTGKDFETKGVKVTINEAYGGRLFELRKI